MAVAIAPTRELTCELPDFKRALLAEYSAWRENYRSALEHAIVVGEMLTEAKQELPHGEWKSWIAENFPGHYVTATEAMRVADAWRNDQEALRDADGQMPQSIRGVIGALRRGKHERFGSARQALANAQVDDEEPETLYTLTLSQLTSLARQRWHRPPEEPQVLQWLRAEGIAA